MKPYVGTLMWAWFSYFNPHRFTWGITYDFPFALIIASVTIVAWVLSREPKRYPNCAITWLLALLAFWMTITTITALEPSSAFAKWGNVMKVLGMTVVTMTLIGSCERINGLIWVTAASLGFFGIKGGIFVILTGGNFLVWGPPGSALAANNAIGLALVVTIPLIRYLQLETKSWIVYLGLGAAIGLSSIAVLATYSRGAALALGGMFVFMWLKSRHRALIATMAAIAVAAGLTVMPEKLSNRINSIQDYQSDWSSMDRIKMWRYAFNLAMDRPLVGGGFDIIDKSKFYPRFGLQICQGPAIFLSPEDPCVLKSRTAHSIYFEALGEHGFVGLILYLALGATTFFTGGWVIRASRKHDDLAWAGNLAAMLQVSIAGFAMAGIFVNKTYLDLYFSLVAIMAVTRMLVAERLSESAKAKVETAPQSGPVGAPSASRA